MVYKIKGLKAWREGSTCLYYRVYTKPGKEEAGKILWTKHINKKKEPILRWI